MQAILAIAAGGAVGAVLRHFFNSFTVQMMGSAFPWGILFINVLGSFIMGCFVSAFAHIGEPPQAAKAFLTVGLLGGFTTFSAFSLDAMLLLERGAWTAAAFYIIGSVLFSVMGLAAGMLLIRVLAA